MSGSTPCTEGKTGSLYGAVQDIMGNGLMGPPPATHVDRMVDGQSQLNTLPSLNFVIGR